MAGEETEKRRKKKGTYRIQEVIRAAEVYAVVQGRSVHVWIKKEDWISALAGWCDDYVFVLADPYRGVARPSDRGFVYHSHMALDRATKKVNKER